MPSKLLAAVILLLLCAGNVFAGTIQLSISTTTPTIFEKGNNTVNISISNMGDENALGAYVSLITPEGFTAEDADIGVIKAGSYASAKANLNMEGGFRGIYPLVLRVHYTDANGYPFSAISYAPMTVTTSPPARVRVASEETALGKEGRGKIELSLTNLGDQAKNITTTVFFPDEIMSVSAGHHRVIKSKESASMRIDIRDIGGLVGSAYVGVAVTEYEKDGIHHTLFTPMRIEIVSAKSNAWIIASIAIILGGSAYILWSKKKTREKK